MLSFLREVRDLACGLGRRSPDAGGCAAVSPVFDGFRMDAKSLGSLLLWEPRSIRRFRRRIPSHWGSAG